MRFIKLTKYDNKGAAADLKPHCRTAKDWEMHEYLVAEGSEGKWAIKASAILAVFPTEEGATTVQVGRGCSFRVEESVDEVLALLEDNIT